MKGEKAADPGPNPGRSTKIPNSLAFFWPTTLKFKSICLPVFMIHPSCIAKCLTVSFASLSPLFHLAKSDSVPLLLGNLFVFVEVEDGYLYVSHVYSAIFVDVGIRIPLC